MKKIINFRVLPTLMLAVILGVLLVGLTNFWWWLGVVILLVGATCCVGGVRKAKKHLKLCILLLIFFLVASILTFAEIYRHNNNCANQSVSLEGSVAIATPSDADGKVVAEGYVTYLVLEDLSVDGVKIAGKAEVKVGADVAGQLTIGDRLTAPCLLEKFKVSPNDSRSINKYCDKIFWKASMVDYDEGEENYVVTAHKPKPSDALKLFQKKNLQAATSDNVAAFLYAMTFGDASEIPKEVRQNFAVTGAAHLFAVSGLHIGIIAAAVVFLLKKCKLNARWQVVITMPILIFFCWLCEFSPSSCRALLMIFVAMVARARGLRNDMLSTISFSAILLLLFKPLFLFDISFQLSFFAVFGLIFVGAPLLKIFKEVLPLWLSKTLAATIGANIGLFPFMLIYFENLSLLFVFANLVAIPLVSLGFPIYLACSVIAAIPHMNFLLAGIGSLFGVVISVISIIAKVKFLKISIVAAWWMIAPHVVFLVFVSNFCMISSKPRVAVSIAASCVVALSCVLSMRGVIAPQTEIFTTMDAHGNGYVAVKSTYGNYLVLTDQTSFDGRGQVAEWLFENNIDTLDGVALCEAQNDTQHLERLLKGVNIKHIFARQPDIRLQKYAKSWQGGLVENDKVAISFLDNRQLQIVFDGVVIAVLPNDYVGYDALKSDILFGENKNSYSKIEKYVVDDKNVANSKKFLSWGCLFTIKNGKIRLA